MSDSSFVFIIVIQGDVKLVFKTVVVLLHVM
jgi:hypothetical protein